MHNFSFQTADHLSDLLPKMFPDSKIAPDFGCKHTKTKSIHCDALDPYYKKSVIQIAQTASFNLLCDESDDKEAPVKLLTVLVQFLNGVVATRHLDTVAVVDFTANGIFVGLESTLQKYGIPFGNMLSFTSDTCSIMKGAREGVIAYLRKS